MDCGHQALGPLSCVLGRGVLERPGAAGQPRHSPALGGVASRRRLGLRCARSSWRALSTSALVTWTAGRRVAGRIVCLTHCRRPVGPATLSKASCLGVVPLR